MTDVLTLNSKQCENARDRSQPERARRREPGRIAGPASGTFRFAVAGRTMAPGPERPASAGPVRALCGSPHGQHRAVRAMPCRSDAQPAMLRTLRGTADADRTSMRALSQARAALRWRVRRLSVCLAIGRPDRALQVFGRSGRRPNAGAIVRRPHPNGRLAVAGIACARAFASSAVATARLRSGTGTGAPCRTRTRHRAGDESPVSVACHASADRTERRATPPECPRRFRRGQAAVVAVADAPRRRLDRRCHDHRCHSARVRRNAATRRLHPHPRLVHRPGTGAMTPSFAPESAGVLSHE